MLLKPSPELLRPHSFSLPRIMATNLSYLPTLQESDVICYAPNQVTLLLILLNSDLNNNYLGLGLSSR